MSKQQVNLQEPFLMILFGGAGDLARRKLFPALYSLHRNGLIHDRFAVVGLGRSVREQEEYRSIVRESVEKYSRWDTETEQDWSSFLNRFRYVSLDVADASGYKDLLGEVEGLEQKWHLPQNRLFYLAISPRLFGDVAIQLKEVGLTQTRGWRRLVIEKPFGHDYPSAKELNDQITGSFLEEEIYRIDHYLGKEMVQNITVIRFANSLFEAMWNNRYISHVQITAGETVGVGERAAYYDHAGALRDMVQNHILQMVTMVAMEPPSRLKPEAIHDEKVKVLRSLRRWKEEDVATHMVRGQYTAGLLDGKPAVAYREEEGVPEDSTNETFVAGKWYIDNFRWSGVPFYIRTGKRLDQKVTEVVIQFKGVPQNLYFNKNNDLAPNLLVIRINPDEGLSFQMNAKKPGGDPEVVPIAMEFCNNCDVESPEAYESLLRDALEGDRTFFTHWDEVSLAWKFIDPIRRVWDQDKDSLCFYEAGSSGPVEADALLAKDGFHWHSPRPRQRSIIQGSEIGSSQRRGCP
ncbi:glucose-6-phosphate dehydrogenase [Desmospora profundinema]|uniref:Glucose-6-phosphate 1-dehydrogenase n=1 Tax=Desmospora profundinema TaxID=1571184 RepID=A0ABU1IKG2_9BACL|nr:glucose-6-phosphate dehydrogenase [Desmospora profundinema]MDR6225253.1 glucose-6-phosphate 1-dehydrogenase [Desmospora profundinema]